MIYFTLLLKSESHWGYYATDRKKYNIVNSLKQTKLTMSLLLQNVA